MLAAVFSLLALLNDVGFPTKKLYELIQEIAEGYCLVTMQIKHQMRPNYLQILPDEKAEFEALKEMICKDYHPSKFCRNKKAKECASRYKPWSPSESDGIDPQSIRYIGADDVDWFLEREMIIVPKDFETVERLERLKKTQAWRIRNFARRPEDIKYPSEFWQNILICG